MESLRIRGKQPNQVLRPRRSRGQACCGANSYPKITTADKFSGRVHDSGEPGEHSESSSKSYSNRSAAATISRGPHGETYGAAVGIKPGTQPVGTTVQVHGPQRQVPIVTWTDKTTIQLLFRIDTGLSPAIQQEATKHDTYHLVQWDVNPNRMINQQYVPGLKTTVEQEAEDSRARQNSQQSDLDFDTAYEAVCIRQGAEVRVNQVTGKIVTVIRFSGPN